MGKINIFQGFSNEYKTYDRTGKIKNILAEIYPKVKLNRFVVLESGNKIDGSYYVGDNDIIFIREKPGAVGCAIFAVVSAGIALGCSIYSAVENQKAQKKLEEEQRRAKRKQDALAEVVEESPFIKGTNNQSALGRNIPFIMGRVYMSPYTLGSGVYNAFNKDGIPGKEQSWSSSLVVGFNDVFIESVSLDNSKIAVADSTIAVPQIDGSTKNFDYITPNRSAQPFVNSDYYDPENAIEIRTHGDTSIPNLTIKTKSTVYADELAHESGQEAVEVLKKLAENTYKFDVCVEVAGLREYIDDDIWYTETQKQESGRPDSDFDYFHPFLNKWKLKEGWVHSHVRFDVLISNTTETEAPLWLPGPIIDTGWQKTNKTMRFVATANLPNSFCFDKNINIKIVRTTESSSNNSQERASLAYINCYQYDVKKSNENQIVPCELIEQPWKDKTTRLAVRVIANDYTKDVLEKINVIACGGARIWDGNSWTQIKYPTRNPASWILEVLTSNTHKHSKYLDSEIDLVSLGALYEYCEQENYSCDGVIYNDEKKSDILTKILTECNATMFLDFNGKWTFAIEKAQSTPVALLNEQSIKSISVAKSFARTAFAQKVTFTNNKNWEVDTAYFDNEGNTQSSAIYDKEKVITETAVNYITDFNHAFKFAHRLMAKQKLQPREVTVQVGHEGDYYPLFSMVLLQTKQLKIGLSSGTIKAIQKNYAQETVSITTSDIVDFTDTSKTYGIIIQAQTENGKTQLYKRVTGYGKTRTVNFEIPINDDLLSVGNIYSFGYLNDNADFEKITNKMMITSTKPNTDGWELVLKDYNDAIFDYGIIPEYKTNLTQPPTTKNTISEKTYRERQNQINGELTELVKNLEIGISEKLPNVFTELRAVATKDGLKIATEFISGSIAETPTGAIFQLSKDNGTTWKVISKNGTSENYNFIRSIDGYPEREDFATWKIRATALNIYGKEAADYIESFVDYSNYGTWKINIPTIDTRVSDRTITLIMSQPARADNREIYGNLKYKVQIKRPDIDNQYFKPATSVNPYPEEQEQEVISNEENYKDGTGFVESDSVYIQTLPLIGQGTSQIIDTLYSFRVVAFNEIEETESVEINATALCTSIRDIVKANEDYKKLYVSELSAISANLGIIKQGSLNGNDNNYWALSTVGTRNNEKQGAMRVGGKNQYLRVTPSATYSDIEQTYDIDFNVGHFQVDSKEVKLGSEQKVYNKDDPFNQAFISPNKLALQHRNTEASEWQDIARVSEHGFTGKAFMSNDALIVTNQDITQRRANGLDIGYPYLSANSKVYHFDTDENDQFGNTDLTITTELGGTRQLVQKGFVINGQKTLPAILAYAPYSEIGASLFGQYSVTTNLTSPVFTFDFWQCYLYAENQTLFQIGNNNFNIALEVINIVAFYNQWIDEENYFLYNRESSTNANENYYQYELLDEPFFADEYNQKTETESPYNTLAKDKYNATFTYYKLTNGSFIIADVNSYNYDELLQTGLYKQMAVYNNVEQARTVFIIREKNKKTKYSFADLFGVDYADFMLEPFNWYHLGILRNGDNFYLYFNDVSHTFTKTSVPNAITATINKDKNSFMLDELCIDQSTVANLENFAERTLTKKPFGSLSDADNWNILTVDNPQKLKTNIFENETFNNSVKGNFNSVEFSNAILSNTSLIHSIGLILIPIGFVYVQYPWMEAPYEIWTFIPQANWIKITDERTELKNAFFRLEGDNAGTSQLIGANKFEFYTKQTSQLPNIRGSFGGTRTDHGLAASFMGFSGAFVGTGQAKRTAKCSEEYTANETMEFNASLSNSTYVDGGEVRPANFTIRIWKRIS